MRPVEGTYPIVIGGVAEGELRVSHDGLMTVFDACCRDTGELLRLSVYGEEGGEGYLGVMLPDGVEYRLVRRLSRTAMAGFPTDIGYAGPAGQIFERERTPEAAAETHPEPEPLCETEAPELEPEPEGGTLGLWLPPESVTAASEPPAPALPEGDIEWRRGRFGVLRSGEPDAELVAVPLGGEEASAADFRHIRVIEGERYAVFQVKNGKLI